MSVLHPDVSVLTPTRLDAPRLGFLAELAADLRASDVDYEWIVVIDGADDAALPDALRGDVRTRVLHAGRHVGAASARNLALGIARGRYITSADDDDRVLPGSLRARLVAAADAKVGWVAGPLAHLDGDVLGPPEAVVPAGPVAPGDVWRTWGCPCQPFPLGPTTLLMETELLRCVGGWQGLPQAEDLGMTLAVTAATPGLMLADAVYAYRAHPHQMTVGRDFQQLEPLVRHITFERGRLLAERAQRRSA